MSALTERLLYLVVNDFVGLGRVVRRVLRVQLSVVLRGQFLKLDTQLFHLQGSFCVLIEHIKRQ